MSAKNGFDLNPSWFGRFAYHAMPIRREVVLQNMRTAFGSELSEAEIKRLAQKFYEHLWLTFFENIGLGWMNPEQKKRKLRLDGREHADKAGLLGKGVILIGGHFGNWEMAPIMCTEHFPNWKGRAHVVRRTLVNKAVEKILFGRYHSAGLQVIPKRNSLGRVLELLEQKEVVVFIMDQHAKPNKDGVVVDFFGKKAGTFKSLAILAGMSGAPVVPAYCFREKDGTHVMKFLPALEWISDPDPDREILLNTRRYNETLEKMIREHPDQWLWLHKRWKIKEA